MVFRKYFLLYFLVAMAGSLLFIFLGERSNRYIYPLLILLWILLCAVVLLLRENRKIANIWRQAREQARPDLAVAAYRPVVAKRRRRVLRHVALMTHYSVALIEAGQAQEALHILDVLQQNLKGRQLQQAWPVIQNNRCSALLQLERTAEAIPLLEELAQFIRAGRQQNNAAPNMSSVMEIHIVLLLFIQGILCGNTEGALPYFNHLLEAQGNPMDRAHTLYYLGLVYEQQADTGTAATCFTDAMRLGGTCWCALRSRAKLQAYGAPLPPTAGPPAAAQPF